MPKQPLQLASGEETWLGRWSDKPTLQPTVAFFGLANQAIDSSFMPEGSTGPKCARETRLGRKVAIKVLPESFVSDPERQYSRSRTCSRG